MSRPKQAKRRIIKIACWGLGVLIALAVLATTVVHSRTIYTCLHCRAERTNHRLFGYPWQSLCDTEFTKWYLAHKPAHEHSWERCSCTRGRNIFGGTIRWACGRIHPIGLFPPQEQRKFAEVASATELSAFYQGILSTNRETQKEAIESAWNVKIEAEKSSRRPTHLPAPLH